MTDCWSIILHCGGVKRPNFFLSSPFAWVYDCILMIWVILIEMGFTTRVQRETHLCILSCKYLFHILPAKKNHLNAIIQISSLICTTTRRKYRIVCGEFGQGVAQLNDKTKEFNCRLCWWLIGHKPIKEVWFGWSMMSEIRQSRAWELCQPENGCSLPSWCWSESYA